MCDHGHDHDVQNPSQGGLSVSHHVYAHAHVRDQMYSQSMHDVHVNDHGNFLQYWYAHDYDRDCYWYYWYARVHVHVPLLLWNDGHDSKAGC